MNKFKKILAGLAVTAGIGCLVGAAACSKAPKYYDLTFDASNVDIIMVGDLAELDENGNPFDAINGGKVKSGIQVSFKVAVGGNATGTVRILVDGVEITPDEDGVYSFVIKKNSSVKVEGISALYKLNLQCAERVMGDTGKYVYEERMFTYTDVSGNTMGKSVVVSENEEFKFKLNVTPYYVRENASGGTAYSVICGTQELIPDSTGVYTVSNLTEVPAEGMDIFVTGMEQEKSFTERENCGNGTADDPYLISRPIDIYYIAALTNLDLYNYIYGQAYYKLVDDIDLEGAQAFVIGDYSDAGYGPSIFMGQFDGNGKTIKNFYLTDEVIDQESYAQEYLPYLGLFGYVSASFTNPVTIKNLTLENCEVRVHTGASKTQEYAAPLLGFGVGVQIYGCNVKDSRVNVTGSDSYQAFVGGMVGMLQAAYGNTGRGLVTFDSYVHASNVVNLRLGGTGSLRIAGGVVGYLVSSDINAISYVSNTTVTGEVIGGMHAGGIAGVVSRFSSINNCYTNALVSARNDGMQYTEEYRNAYGGGIAGYADEDSLIYGCYVANKSGVSATSVSGANYGVPGTYAGYVSPGGESAVGSSPALIINNGDNASISGSTWYNDLGWVVSEWDMTGANPVSIVPSAERTVTITVKEANGTAVGSGYTKVLGATRYTMSSWYRAENIAEYLTKSDKRSYGYYFSADGGKLTGRVPYGFIPSSDVTLYVDFVDYSEVAGTYYVQSAPRSNGAYISLGADGTAVIRNGGMNDVCTFYYDGEKVTLPFSILASLSIGVEYSDGGKHSFVGTKIDGGNGLRFDGIGYIVEVDLETGESTTTSENIQFVAYKERTDISYGEYAVTTDTSKSFTFNAGMNGYRKDGNVVRSFTYTINGNIINATYVNTSGGFSARLDGGVVIMADGLGVTKKNAFSGTYKHSANSVFSYTFDGLTSVNGVDYQVTEGRATFTIDDVHYVAYFDQDGMLVVDNGINSLVYYPADGFTGMWYFDGVSNSLEKIELTLEGISNDGYGYATISYMGGVTVDAQYDVLSEGSVNKVRIFAGDMQYGELTLDAETGVARGMFYSATDGGYYTNVPFNLYDALKGVWVSNAEGIDTVIFTGKTATGINSVVLRLESGKIAHGEYTLTTSVSGTLKVGDDEYDLTFDELNNKIELKKKGQETVDKTFAQRDSWYGTVLYDGDTTYTFDGKGYIGGKVTVSDGRTLTYTIANGVVTMDGKQLDPSQNGFTYDGKELKFNTGFMGEWLVGGTQKKLTVSEVLSDFTALVTYEDDTGEYYFAYNPENGTLTLREVINGQAIVTVLKKSGSIELSLSRTGDVNLSCIKAELQDSFMGVYVYNGTSWSFDGLGNCVFGEGIATYTASNGDKTVYYYKINKLGMPYISSLGQVFTESETGYQKVGESKSYNMAMPNYLYEQRVLSGEKWYYFDGFGWLYAENNGTLTKEYEYVIVDSNTVTLKKDGNVYTGKLEKKGTTTILTIE